MYKTAFISTFLLLSLGMISVSDAGAQSRRHRMHSRWIVGLDTSYLEPAHYNSCWTASQAMVAPDSITRTRIYNNCLRTSGYYSARHPRRRNRIAASCNATASRLVYPTDYQQQTSYTTCLRRTRYNLIREYLVTVTCDHLYGRARARCVNRLYADIASYGYNSAAHLTYLDNLYRTRYRTFSTRYPRHKFVKRYGTRHHTRRVPVRPGHRGSHVTVRPGHRGSHVTVRPGHRGSHVTVKPGHRRDNRRDVRRVPTTRRRVEMKPHKKPAPRKRVTRETTRPRRVTPMRNTREKRERRH
ncbi:MAG: hypothetical protein JXR95_01585 [Deltaproteobacteria bacterium]|nr:hypothetical protein [Deltaproteobacteria bacterium]